MNGVRSTTDTVLGEANRLPCGRSRVRFLASDAFSYPLFRLSILLGLSGPLAIVGADASRLGGYGLTVLMRSYTSCMEVGQKRDKTRDEASLVPSKLAFWVERDPSSEWAAKIGPWVSGGRSGE